MHSKSCSYNDEEDPACLLPPHAPIRAPTSSYGCLFSFFLSNLIISPPDFKGVGPGLILFQSNQATYAGARMGTRTGSRQVSSCAVHVSDGVQISIRASNG